MKISNDMLAPAAMKELSVRLRDYRISASLTRKELAEKSMVSEGTIKRFENGEDISLKNFIKIVRVLGLVKNFDLIIPDQTERPTYHIKRMDQRQRARKPIKQETAWKWGDEQ